MTLCQISHASDREGATRVHLQDAGRGDGGGRAGERQAQGQPDGGAGPRPPVVQVGWGVWGGRHNLLGPLTLCYRGGSALAAAAQLHEPGSDAPSAVTYQLPNCPTAQPLHLCSDVPSAVVDSQHLPPGSGCAAHASKLTALVSPATSSGSSAGSRSSPLRRCGVKCGWSVRIDLVSDL